MMRDTTIAVFLACAVYVAALVLISRRQRSSSAPIGAVLDGLMANRTARVAILIFWWWLGWHFLAGMV